jgi:hypothetical protein
MTLQLLLQCSCNALLTKAPISLQQSQTNAKQFLQTIVVLQQLHTEITTVVN